MNDKCVAIAGWQGGVVTMGHMFPGIWIPAAGWHGISAWRLLFSTAKFSTSSLVAYWSKSCVIWTQSAGGGQYEIGFIRLWLKIVLEWYSYFIFGILIQVVCYLDSIRGRWSIWDRVHTIMIKNCIGMIFIFYFWHFDPSCVLFGLNPWEVVSMWFIQF